MNTELAEPIVAPGYDNASVTRKITDVVLTRPVHRGWIGGFAFAFLYLKKPQHVSIEQLRQRVSPAPDVNDDMTPRASPRPSSRSRIRLRAGRHPVPLPTFAGTHAAPCPSSRFSSH